MGLDWYVSVVLMAAGYVALVLGVWLLIDGIMLFIGEEEEDNHG